MIVVFDVGPLGLAPLYAHGHADALSFCLNYAGQEFLIDPGTYCYYSSPRWRSYFRGTGAHNTIRIDQEDQSVSGGTFLWRQPAVCQMIRTRDTDEYAEVVGSHDGYRRLGDPVIHVRGLHLDKKSRVLVITDRIECRRNHEAELFFHFSERCHVQQVGSAAYEVVNDRARVEIQLDSRFNSVLYKGAEDPICGWVSPGFGVRKPSFTLVARAPVTATTEFLTEISGR